LAEVTTLEQLFIKILQKNPEYSCKKIAEVLGKTIEEIKIAQKELTRKKRASRNQPKLTPNPKYNYNLEDAEKRRAATSRRIIKNAFGGKGQF